jgi:chemotaxis protein MotB
MQNQPGAGRPERNETDQSPQREDQYQMIRANLSQQIQQGLAEVERAGDTIIIRLAEQGTFDSGQAELKPAFYGLLDSVGSSIEGTRGNILIEGHTDNVPIGFGSRYRNNWDLSAARSAAVADYLLSRDLVSAGRITVAGFADTRSIADNDSATGRAQNRRIEIIISND